MTNNLVSICIPVLNEEKNIPKAYKRVCDVFEQLPEFRLEFVFTDNASTDDGYALLEALAKTDSRIRVARFSTNYGYQKSILAGYMLSQGAAVIQLDCDLQDPPELIPKMLEKWQEGYAVVYGIRTKRQEPISMQLIRKTFYRGLNMISDNEIPIDAGDFRLLDRKIVNAIKIFDDQSPYIRGLISSLGFKQTGISYERDRRVEGYSKFRPKQLFELAADAVVSNSFFPLRLATYIGFFMSVVALTLFLATIVAKLGFQANWPAGFATLAILGILNIAVTATFLGIFGAYIGRVLKQVRTSPMVIIDKGIRVGTVPEGLKDKVVDLSSNQPSVNRVIPR